MKADGASDPIVRKQISATNNYPNIFCVYHFSYCAPCLPLCDYVWMNKLLSGTLMTIRCRADPFFPPAPSRLLALHEK